MQLQALLPPGAAWPRDPETTLIKLLDGLSEELARIDARTDDLRDEADPRSTIETLAEWETAYGLPDICAPVVGLIQERHDALLARITGSGGQSRAYFIDVADRLGFAVTIDEFDPLTCVDPCTGALCGDDWDFAWQINGPEETIRSATCLDGCTAPLREWGNETLECTMGIIKPAHTVVQFRYG